jgi:hypothetical protein
VPIGSFVIIIPLEKDYKVLGYYFKEEKPGFKISNDLFLRLNLDHSKDEYSLLKLKENIIFSYLYKFKGKLRRKASGVIIGLLLHESDKPDKFRASLKEGAEALEVLGPDLINLSQEEFESILKDIYLEHLEPLIDILKPEALKNNIIDTSKFMLGGGKKERRIAQELLKKVEEGVHEKITEYYNIANNFLKELEYEKAAKNFIKAAEIAQEMYVIDIADSLKEKANYANKVPDISKSREKLIQDARNFLRNEDFHSAYIAYKEASELSKKLVDFEKEEEYRLKSRALEEFYRIDKKYKSQ